MHPTLVGPALFRERLCKGSNLMEIMNQRRPNSGLGIVELRFCRDKKI
jgi:hypothetical protein